LARYNKKRAREIQKDVFREKTMDTFKKAGEKLEGKGRSILYGLAALVVIGAAAWAFVAWQGKKSDEAHRALGRAIEITDAPVSATPVAGSSGPSFTSERERSQRAVEEFQKVAAKYSGQTRDVANFFIATNLLNIDRAKGMSQLQSLAQAGDKDVAARAKFALALAYEDDGKLDNAAALYKELAQANTVAVPADSANLRLALVEEKQGKNQEAANLLFDLVNKSRTAKSSDGQPLPPSGASSQAETELEKLDPAKYAQLPPKAAPAGFPL
jgi:hypothetical protein